MAQMTFNGQLPTVTFFEHRSEKGDWPADDWKYADVEHVYPRTSNLVRKIIDATPLTGRFKRVLIDVKVQDLTPDIYSCVPGWHLDGAFPQDGVDPDRHHLFIMGGPATEFIIEPVVIDVCYLVRGNNGVMLPSMAHVVEQIPADVKFAPAQQQTITSFTSYDFHRGVRAETPCRRLLVRLTETNTVLPRNTPKAPSHGARHDEI